MTWNNTVNVTDHVDKGSHMPDTHYIYYSNACPIYVFIAFVSPVITYNLLCSQNHFDILRVTVRSNIHGK